MALDAIVLYKHDLLRDRERDIEALRPSVEKSDRSLLTALTGAHASFICEIKPASPSKGVLRADTDVVAIADIYAPFASAISVLADEKFFGGSLDNVRRVSERVSCPVLAKDVVVSPLQIIEARAHGAHAVLLMLSVLDDKTYRACAQTAHELAMDFITEVHDEHEMARANNLGAKIIGINNRNLKTLAIDMTTTERLAPLANKNAIVIAESGIYTRAQVKQFAPLVHGFLIGTALMQSAHIDRALRELIFGRVKICGLTNSDDARHAYRAGAYYGGINCAPVSKRVVSIACAQEIISSAPLVFGGVFVNQSVDEVVSIALKLNLAFVQLHGDESPQFLAAVRTRLPLHVEVWRAVRVRDGALLAIDAHADRILLDAFHDHEFGGTGIAFDWNLLHDYPKHHFILAGGIKPDNVARADAHDAFALDIASGVEDSDPRKKSASRINELFFNLRPRGCS